MHIGRQAIALDRVFAGLVAQGIGIWIGVQAFINMGVNLGVLPTKGLTLPLMSYGGSAILMNLVALAMVLRIDYENRRADARRPRMSARCALVMAGGTGGHIFPGLAVAEALRARGWRVHWLGTPRQHGKPARAAARLRVRDRSTSPACAARAWCTLALLPLRLLHGLLAKHPRRAARASPTWCSAWAATSPSRAA